MKEQTTQWLQSLGFEIDYAYKDKHGKAQATSCRLGTVVSYLQHVAKEELALDDVNRKIAIEYLGMKERAPHTWAGTTGPVLMQNLQGETDMREFFQAKEKFSKSDLASKLREKYQDCQPKRQRKVSEYEGEFIEARRYDIAPFQGIEKVLGGGRYLDVIAYSNVLGGAGAEELNSYGAMTWALIDLIEAMGINCRVILRYDASNCVDDDKNSRMRIDVECKKAGEYLAPSLLAGACQASFFRRGIFALKAALADAWGKTISTSMGMSIQQDKLIRFEDGALILAPGVQNARFEEIEKVLLEAVA